MIKNKRVRRSSAVILLFIGALLMFLAPQAWPGAMVLAVGVLLELLGISLERKDKRN